MTFTEAQEAARSAFAQTRTPGLDAVAGMLQRVVTNEQNRLAAEVAKVEGRCTDLENKTRKLKRELAALQAQSDKLAAAGQGLAEALMNDHALNDALETWDAALADWRTARENS